MTEQDLLDLIAHLRGLDREEHPLAVAGTTFLDSTAITEDTEEARGLENSMRLDYSENLPETWGGAYRRSDLDKRIGDFDRDGTPYGSIRFNPNSTFTEPYWNMLAEHEVGHSVIDMAGYKNILENMAYNPDWDFNADGNLTHLDMYVSPEDYDHYPLWRQDIEYHRGVSPEDQSERLEPGRQRRLNNYLQNNPTLRGSDIIDLYEAVANNYLDRVESEADYSFAQPVEGAERVRKPQRLAYEQEAEPSGWLLLARLAEALKAEESYDYNRMRDEMQDVMD